MENLGLRQMLIDKEWGFSKAVAFRTKKRSEVSFFAQQLTVNPIGL
ncbi:MAG: hypothetical protein KDF49_05970 [Nitrosomonas sp.]|nr:hypothetical protein [Nitrosomonas sp.]